MTELSMEKFLSPIDSLEKEHLILNRDYEDLLKNLKLLSFEAIWNCRDGETVKKIKERSVIRIRMQTSKGKRYFYLKHHKHQYIGLRRLFAPIFFKPFLSEGKKEFQNICDFREKKIATVVPVAAGEKFTRFFWVKSFLVTEDFSPFVSLEDLLENQPEFFMGPDSKNRKKILIDEVTLLARRMHKQGLNHRDFNSTHILLHYDRRSDVPKVALFDLQRVDRNRFLSFRWMVKSLARLNYSLPAEIFNAEDRICLFLSYIGEKRLQGWNRLLWFWIERKTKKIKKHTGKW